MKQLVIETAEVSDRGGVDKAVNPYLKLGWVIVETWVVGDGDPRERNETFHALLGWIDRSRSPVHPQKEVKQWDKF
jgi:hypothetical protein